MPLDERPELAYELTTNPDATMDAVPIVGHKVRRNHFATCQDADRWRRR